MYATRRQIFQSGTPSRTTLPLALTKQISANSGFPCEFSGKIYGAVRQGARRFVFADLSPRCTWGYRWSRGCATFEPDALEFVNEIVELLEIEGGLVAARLLVPAKNQAILNKISTNY